jgi:hypothetical protein
VVVGGRAALGARGAVGGGLGHGPAIVGVAGPADELGGRPVAGPAVPDWADA